MYFLCFSFCYVLADQIFYRLGFHSLGLFDLSISTVFEKLTTSLMLFNEPGWVLMLSMSLIVISVFFLPFYNIKVRIFLTLRESNGRKYFPAFTHRVMACAGAVANVLLYRTTIK